MDSKKTIPLGLSAAQREAVRTTSPKYNKLKILAEKLDISEVYDIQIVKFDKDFDFLDTLGHERMLYELITNQYDAESSHSEGLLMHGDVYGTIEAVRANRKSLARFDEAFENIMSTGVSIQAYDMARNMCPMSLGEYMTIELEECRSLRPDCKTGFTLSFYVSDGHEIRIFKFSEDEVVEIASDVSHDMAVSDNMMDYEIYRGMYGIMDVGMV